MKKPKFMGKIKTEAVVASFLLVFLIGFGLFFVSGFNTSDEVGAVPEPQPDGGAVQPGNETSLVDESLGSVGYWSIVKIPGMVMTLIPKYGTTYSVSALSGTVVNAPDNTPSSENSDSGSLQIIQGDNGEITLVDDNGEEIDWNDLPEDVKNDLKKLFPELFDDFDDQISDNETQINETNQSYPEAEEEDLNLSDIDYGDDDGFSDDFDDELNPDENQTQNNTQDDNQNSTGNQTGNDTGNNDTSIDTGNDEVGQVEEVNPQDDDEEFPEEVPEDLPDEDWINDWING
ncbi:MAG: hypothetical protein ACC609_09090 [Methanobacterium formicicum]